MVHHTIAAVVLALALASTISPGVYSFTPVACSSRTNKHPSLLFASSDGNYAKPIVALNVILRVKPEVRQEFLEVILNNQLGTLNKELEPLAIEYIFGEDESEPNTFHFHEKYQGDEGVEAHNAAPHFKLWEDFVATDPFTAPPEVYKYVIHQ